MNAQPNPTKPVDCWQLISRGALPPATAIAKNGAPTWDLPAILAWTKLSVEQAVSALSAGAEAVARDQAGRRHSIPAPEHGHGNLSIPKRSGACTGKRKSFTIKPARQG